jgi:hypothetical protein
LANRRPYVELLLLTLHKTFTANVHDVLLGARHV